MPQRFSKLEVHEKRIGLIFASGDQQEGMQAFLDKRTPDFAGN